MSGGLALTHGANDAQKSIGIVAALLVAAGEASHLASPLWAELACGAALTAGTALGGWPIIRTIGRRIIRLRPLDALSSQTGSTAVLLGASLIGAPVSTTQVVTSSVVGVAGGRRRWRHVHWPLVRTLALAWLVTIPAAGCARGPRAAALEVALLSKHWFLPKNPDLLGLLCEQSAITVDGMRALVAWAGGEPAADDHVRDVRAQGRRQEAPALARAARRVLTADRRRRPLLPLVRSRRSPQRRQEPGARTSKSWNSLRTRRRMR